MEEVDFKTIGVGTFVEDMEMIIFEIKWAFRIIPCSKSSTRTRFVHTTVFASMMDTIRVESQFEEIM
jgi:hypothetical protein